MWSLTNNRLGERNELAFVDKYDTREYQYYERVTALPADWIIALAPDQPPISRAYTPTSMISAALRLHLQGGDPTAPTSGGITP